MTRLPRLLISWLLVTQSFALKYVHLGPLPSSDHAEVHGHVLSSSASSAIQFSIHHSRPVLFFDELQEDEIKLTHASIHSSNDESENVLTLRLHGASLDPSDFTVPGVVLCIRHSELLEHGVRLPSSGLVDHVYLSVLSSYSEGSSPFSLVSIHAVHLSTNHESAVSFVSFKQFSVIPGSSSKRLRKFHVYGRHSGFPFHMSDQVIQNETSRFLNLKNLNPFYICVYRSVTGIPSGLLGNKPVTICNISLAGTLATEHIPFNPSSFDTPTSSGHLNVSLGLNAAGTFNVTSDKLRFWINYVGSVRTTFDCPDGCSLSEKGVISVPNYHKLVQSTEGLEIPSLPNFRFTSGIDIKWHASIIASGNISLKASSAHSLNMSAPGDPANVDVPSPTAEASAIGKTFGPYVGVTAETFIQTKFRNKGTVIQTKVWYTSGLSSAITEPWDKGAEKCSMGGKELEIRPIFRSVRVAINTTAENLGFDEIDASDSRPPVGKPAIICL